MNNLQYKGGTNEFYNLKSLCGEHNLFLKSIEVTAPFQWTTEEKRSFLLALLQHGDSDLSLLQNDLPQKTVVEIRAMVDYYKRQAEVKWLNNEDRKSDELRTWIDIIERICSKRKGCIQDIIPRVLKYIALYEKKNDQSDIDLCTAYNFLSEISRGQTSKELPERTGYFLYQCLVKLAENLQKQDIKESQMYLEQLHSFEQIMHKADESLVNPLAVPDNLLEVSQVDFSEDITQ